jgi:hypothetical protein
LADKIKPRYTSLIYPGGRWIHQSGKGLAEFGLEQINDVHLALVEFFPDTNYIFKDAGIADGISIVFKDFSKKKTGFTYRYAGLLPIHVENPGEKLMPLNPTNMIIVEKIEKVVSQKGFAYLHDTILPRSLFSIESDFVEKNPSLVREYNVADPFDLETEIKLFTNDKAGKSGRAKWYIANKNIISTGREYINTWKVVVSSANAGGQKRSNQIAILDNHSAFGRSRVALKTFKSEQEAKNFLAYAKSDLIRFAFLLTDESLSSLAKLVPDIGNYHNDNGVIDFSKDVSEQLYNIFKITDQQTISHIKAVLATKAV